MDSDRLTELLSKLVSQKLTIEQVLEQLKDLPYKNLEFARPDLHRALRLGLPEVIYCPGKTPEQIVAIAHELKAAHSVVIGTKAAADTAEAIQIALPETKYFPQAKLLLWGEMPTNQAKNQVVAVITAGTSDLSVAEEAALYLMASGIAVERIYDVGVAGLHRVIDVLPTIRSCAVAIVIAGMDGVLPGVIAGLVPQPVVAVPTATGYGTNFNGIAPLLTMLNSCAAGVTVVNIDNGFGAAAAALRILSSLKVPMSIQ